jgi:hypothetical protein
MPGDFTPGCANVDRRLESCAAKMKTCRATMRSLAARRPNGMTFEWPARRNWSPLRLPVPSLNGHGTLPLKGEVPVALSNAMLKG